MEGTWGAGAFVENANYSARSGKIMTVSENREVVEVLADLAKRAESGAVGGKFTVGGCASMTGQWAEHGMEALQRGESRSLFKYLQRTRTD